MATEYTPKFNLAKPLVNGPETENTWGFDLNLNFDKIDAAIDEQVSITEVGEIIDDRVAGLIKPGENMAVSYNDAANTLTVTGLIGTEQIDDRVAELLVPGERVGILYDDIEGTLRISATSGEGVGWVPEAPNDGVPYARRSIGWSPTIPEAPTDGAIYGRQDGAWVDANTAVFDTKAAAEAAFMSVGTKSFLLTGYETPGDAGQILSLKRVDAMPTLHEGWVRTQDRYLSTGTVDAANGGYWEYVYPIVGISIEWFGGKADWQWGATPPSTVGTNNTLAYEKARKFITSNYLSSYDYYKGGPTILFGFGQGGLISAAGGLHDIGTFNYRFNSTININERALVLRGPSNMSPSNSGFAVIFSFPKDVLGVLVDTFTGSAPRVPSGYGSVIENITFFADSGGTNTSAHGIRMHVVATLRNCRFSYFAGHGVYVVSNAGTRAGENASEFYFDHVWATHNENGFHISGGDSNVGVALGISAIGNRGWGVYDDSYLGSTYINIHTRGNLGGSIYSDGVTGRSVFIGCYAEGDQQPDQIGNTVTFIGGLRGSGSVVKPGGLDIVGNVVRGGLELSPPGFAGRDPDRVSYSLRTAVDNLWTMGFTGSSYTHEFKYETATGVFGLAFSTAYNWGIAGEKNTFTAGRSATAGYPGDVEPNAQMFARGLYLGTAYSGTGTTAAYNTTRHIGVGTVAPTSGIFAKGEFLLNSNATVGGAVGWVCTTGGGLGVVAWASGTNYNMINFSGPNLAGTVSHGGNYYKIVYDPNLYASNPEPLTNIKFNLQRYIALPTTAILRSTVGNVDSRVMFILTMTGWPLPVGRTARISMETLLGPDMALEGIDYTPTLAESLSLFAPPSGVTVEDTTIIFDHNYVGPRFEFILFSLVTGVWTTGTYYGLNKFIKTDEGKSYRCSTDLGEGVLSTVKPTHTTGTVVGADGYGWTVAGPYRKLVPHLHTPEITGTGPALTAAPWLNDPTLVITDNAFDFTIKTFGEKTSLNEDVSGNVLFMIELHWQPMPLGVSASIDIELDPASTATDGVDYTPTLAEAIAAAPLPAGVTRVGNRLTFQSPADPPLRVAAFTFTLTRADDAPVEGLEKIIIKLTNPTLSGASATTFLGVPIPEITIDMTETILSTVPPTHTSGDQNYPELDPVSGDPVPGYTWRYMGAATPAVWSPFGNSVLEGTVVYNPPSLAAGAVDAIQTMTVTGAATGDLVDASFALNLNGAALAAWVSAANTVAFQFRNPTASPIDLGNATVKCRVRK